MREKGLPERGGPSSCPPPGGHEEAGNARTPVLEPSRATRAAQSLSCKRDPAPAPHEGAVAARGSPVPGRRADGPAPDPRTRTTTVRTAASTTVTAHRRLGRHCPSRHAWRLDVGHPAGPEAG